MCHIEESLFQQQEQYSTASQDTGTSAKHGPESAQQVMIKVCTIADGPDSGAQERCPEAHARHIDVHGSEVEGPRCIGMTPQRYPKRDSRARESLVQTPVHSNGILRPIQGTKMCTGLSKMTPVHSYAVLRAGWGI